MRKPLLFLLSLIGALSVQAQHTVSTGSSKYVLLEAAMSTSNKHSPRAYCIEEDFRNNPNILIANVHAQAGIPDPISITDYDDWINQYINGFPTGTVDRVPYNSNQQISSNNWQTALNLQLATAAQYQLTMSISRVGQNLKVFLKGKALTALSGEYRFNVLIIEDSVTQNQQNNNAIIGPCPYLDGSNVLTNFRLRDVLRAALAGSWGKTIVQNPTVNKEDTATFNYTIPASYDMSKMRVIGVVQKYGPHKLDRPIMNAISAKLACAPMAGTITSPATVCGGTAVTVTNTITGGTWGSLRGKFSIDAGGNLKVTGSGKDSIIYLTPGVCKVGYDTAYQAIEVYANPIATQPANTGGPEGETRIISLTGSASASSYRWEMNNGMGFQQISDAGQYSGTGTASLKISNLTTANNNQKYRCIVSDGTCTSTSNEVTLSVFPTSVGNNAIEQISVSPNPAGNTIQITSGVVISKVEVTDMTGRRLIDRSYNDKQASIDISALNAGVYLIRVNDNYTQKVVKQ
jgi:hypothetical protein